MTNPDAELSLTRVIPYRSSIVRGYLELTFTNPPFMLTGSLKFTGLTRPSDRLGWVIHPPETEFWIGARPFPNIDDLLVQVDALLPWLTPGPRTIGITDLITIRDHLIAAGEHGISGTGWLRALQAVEASITSDRVADSRRFEATTQASGHRVITHAGPLPTK